MRKKAINEIIYVCSKGIAEYQLFNLAAWILEKYNYILGHSVDCKGNYYFCLYNARGRKVYSYFTYKR